MANHKTEETKAPSEEEQLLDDAVTWAFTHDTSNGGTTCPFCSKDFRLNEETKPNPQKVRDHISNQHSSRVMLAWAAKDIGVDLRTEDDSDEGMGLVERLAFVDEYDKTDFLHVDPSVREDARRNGDVLRWVAPRNMTRIKSMGAENVTVKTGDNAITMQTGGDGSAKANEMTLMRIPAALAHKRKQTRHRRADNELASRKEEMENQADEQEKLIYDKLIAEGTEASKARQVSTAVAGRADGGDWRGRDDGAHQGIRIS
tara:strand:- start:2413 stop:3189 length:777 start_codon:yes stop_codon:yes gene_type:complete